MNKKEIRIFSNYFGREVPKALWNLGDKSEREYEKDLIDFQLKDNETFNEILAPQLTSGEYETKTKPKFKSKNTNDLSIIS